MTPQNRGTPLVWDTTRLRIATDAAGVALWSWNVDTDAFDMDERSHSLWGIALEPVTFEDLSARIHPEDLDRVRAAFAATREMSGVYEIDFRILFDGGVRWISARGRGSDQGIVDRIIFGVFLEVTERKLAEEARELLTSEMEHRVKNLFAIAAALTSISERSSATKAEMSRDLTQRLTALNHAQGLVRPTLSKQKRAAHLADLITVLLSAYTEEGGRESRIRVSVPELLVGDTSTTALALIFHELATNSIKYGALSSATGTVDVTCSDRDDGVTITWTEKGGPPVSAAAGRSGFGSQLVNNCISGQLGGAITADWRTEGVVITLRLNEARLGV